MKPAIARSIVFNSFNLAIAGKIAAVKSEDPFLSWVFLNKKFTSDSKVPGRSNGKSVIARYLNFSRNLCQSYKMLGDHTDKHWINFWVYGSPRGYGETLFESCESIAFNKLTGVSVFKKNISTTLEELTDLQCIRIAYALTFFYVHETKSTADENAQTVRKMFGI